MLSHRAFTEMAYSPVPSFAAACDFPWINWTHPEVLPSAIVDPVKFTYKGQRGFDGDRSYNSPEVDTDKYYPMFLINHRTSYTSADENFTKLDLFDFPAAKPDVTYVIASSNRGRTHLMTKNPYHRKDFWRFGVTPDNAFMCGFFFLCSPNAAVQHLLKHFWEQLNEASFHWHPGALRR